ncbi:hypothetical protein HX045_02265 [Myroides odoratimimus]|uniref:Uncharacterized protein n=4 Tax=Myroides TaxID=76831 RepID=A0A0S7E6E0_9FLAO|nr:MULTISPECIES: DUF6327 family protein [Myroides]AJA68311.1 hypothetical protein MYRA21_1151 [Myroides sp. A21]AJH13235.1 hypothetical protein MPR_0016 [Myroides profundi]ALU25603.1 hypothetical protein AS202_05395 [Myroides odoratimimus]APA91632.1 hypothetical protein BK054_05275 [Myroides sp. ZB35]EHO10841.1 hypothetical protein HMPREF9712_01189 [Myroides odoratimimus CCUG 10230]
MRKSYSSFEEIKYDLEVLKLKKDIHYHKVFRAVDNIKTELSPDRVVRNTLGSVTSYVKGSSNIQAFLITTALKYFFKNRTKNK